MNALKRLIPRCSNCRKEDTLYSGIKRGENYTNLCEHCVGNLGSSEFYQRSNRQSQRRAYAKDIIQPSESDYIKAYGPEKAREAGWSENDIRRFS